MKVLSLFLLIIIMFAQDCRKRSTNTFENATNTEEVRKAIRFVKNPCSEQCPVYSLTISNDGTLDYIGAIYTPRLGFFTKQIPKDQVTALLKDFDAIKFWEMEDIYPSNVIDLSSTIITVFEKDTFKAVFGNISSFPRLLLKIDKQLTAIANAKNGWTLTKKHPGASNLPDHFIKNEIIAKFLPNTDLSKYIETQQQFEVAIKKRVSPNLDLWVLTFDTTKIDPSLMLLHLKETSEVIEAHFNKKPKPQEH